MLKQAEQAKEAIRDYIAGSSTPEDPAHAENTLEWLLRLRADADLALQFAALGHDIDRASPNKVRRHDFADYDAFKAAHALHGAAILRDILRAHYLPPDIIACTSKLVELHETGGNPNADILKDADSLSYFDTNLPHYLAREGEKEAVRRSIWGLERLSDNGLQILKQWRFEDRNSARVVAQALEAYG